MSRKFLRFLLRLRVGVPRPAGVTGRAAAELGSIRCLAAVSHRKLAVTVRTFDGFQARRAAAAPPPPGTNTWPSLKVSGERIWLPASNRYQVTQTSCLPPLITHRLLPVFRHKSFGNGLMVMSQRALTLY